MSDRNEVKDVAAEFAFRIESTLPPIAFGEALDLSGWLLDLLGRPIHGIRAVLRRRWGRKQIVRARRKRQRLDIAAAFPDLQDARASGFLLELRPRIGRNDITFQVLDHARVWRTFHQATLFAFPLAFFARVGLTNVQQFLTTYLPHAVAGRSPAPPRKSGPAPSVTNTPTAISTKRVHLFAASKSNLFILEIGELAAAGFRELGLSAELRLDQIPEENPPADTLQIVVTPHEYYNLFLSGTVRRPRARELTRNVFLLCTEQPDTGWFQSNLQWGSSARGVADINAYGVRAYRDRGLRCHQFQLGYHSILAHGEPPTPHLERSCDITFLGSMTDRRDHFFAAHAEFFARHECHLRLVPLGFAKTTDTKSYLSVERRNALLSQSKLLLNVHYSEQKYFEWHRMLVGLANGCCVITETCPGYGALVPGRHFIMVEPEYLIPCCEYYLAHPEECAAIAQAGAEFIRSELRQSQACESFLRELQSPQRETAPREMSDLRLPQVAGDAPPEPLAAALQRTFAHETARLFRRALATDLRAAVETARAWLSPRPLLSPAATPHDSALRAATIAKREAYRDRFVAQEKAAAAGEPAFRCYDNEAFLNSPPPQVSIVITLYNYEQFIEECLDSVHAASVLLSPPPEIVIVNDASTDNSLARARHCQAQSRLPLRIIDKQFNTGLADARNVGVRHARAPYVFMLDADNLIYPRALEQLLARLTTTGADAAYTLLCRFRGDPSNRVGLLSYFDWDPQMLVQAPYIDAMAMFRRETLLQLAGYDNRLSQIGWFGWEDYELWLRFAQRNHPVTFVPNILCLYRHHETSMINTTNLFERELVQHFVDTYSELVTRFLPRERLFGVDRTRVPPPAASKKTTYFIASGCGIATTTLYRCVHLQEQLQSLGYEVELSLWFHEADITPAKALQADVIFLYRLPMSAPLEALIVKAHATGKTIVFDTDDLIFAPELIDSHRAVAQLSQAEQKMHVKGVQRYLETMMASDVVTTATPLLSELAQERGKHALVHRNALGTEMLAEANELYAARLARSPGDQIVIGYGSGTATHDTDFLQASTALSYILEHFPEVTLWLAGPLALPASLNPFRSRIKRFPLTDWKGWFKLTSRIDIALAPLELGNVFCRAKSEVKFIESAVLGVPLVASAIDPYEAVITHGDNGFLAANENAWITSLVSLVEQPSLRHDVGRRARARVLQSYSTVRRTADLAHLLSELPHA